MVTSPAFITSVGVLHKSLGLNFPPILWKITKYFRAFLKIYWIIELLINLININYPINEINKIMFDDVMEGSEMKP